MSPTPEELLRLVEARRRDEVADLVRGVREREGFDAVVGLLAGVQDLVGERWQSQRWTVADEHAATAIVDHALAVAGDGAVVGAGAGRVLVACVEDEWHVLPARMLSELLRQRGWDTIFLGASSPADHLGRFAEQAAPVAAALSCSLSLHLPGARRSIEACHAAGTPVVLGGSAVDAERAAAVGADAWCRSAADLHDLLTAWAASPPATLAEPTVPAPEPIDLAVRNRVVDDAMDAVVRRVAPLAEAPGSVVARLWDDLDALLGSAEAAAHVGDPSIVAEQLTWQRNVAASRGDSADLVDLTLDALASAVPPELDLRGQLAVQV